MHREPWEDTARPTRTSRRWLALGSLFLVAVLIGIAALLLLSPSGPLYRSPPRARVDAMTIFAGVQLYRSEHEGCPTIDDLIRAKFLDPSKAHTDPWGNPFQIICTPNQLWIQSAGPDETRHTEDDLEFRQPSPNPGNSSSR